MTLSSSCRQLWMPNAPWFPLQLSCPRSGSCWTAPDITRFQQCRNICFPKFLRVPLAFTISGIECLPLLRTSSWKPLRSVKLQQFCTGWLAESCNWKTHVKKTWLRRSYSSGWRPWNKAIYLLCNQAWVNVKVIHDWRDQSILVTYLWLRLRLRWRSRVPLPLPGRKCSAGKEHGTNEKGLEEFRRCFLLQIGDVALFQGCRLPGLSSISIQVRREARVSCGMLWGSGRSLNRIQHQGQGQNAGTRDVATFDGHMCALESWILVLCVTFCYLATFGYIWLQVFDCYWTCQRPLEVNYIGYTKTTSALPVARHSEMSVSSKPPRKISQPLGLGFVELLQKRRFANRQRRERETARPETAKIAKIMMLAMGCQTATVINMPQASGFWGNLWMRTKRHPRQPQRHFGFLRVCFRGDWNH